MSWYLTLSSGFQPAPIILKKSFGPLENSVCHIFLSRTFAISKWLIKINTTPITAQMIEVTIEVTYLKVPDLNGSRQALNTPYHMKYAPAKSPAFLCLMHSIPKYKIKNIQRLPIPSQKNNGCLHSPSIYMPGNALYKNQANPSSASVKALP
ncbi:MAG: hypothetical protein MJ219_02220 [Mycoplasmoidaceae bacterium]|nr:hypothetical protein [Mycoplasmoidaceae bacterium]